MLHLGWQGVTWGGAWRIDPKALVASDGYRSPQSSGLLPPHYNEQPYYALGISESLQNAHG